jgi:hypothetical protein
MTWNPLRKVTAPFGTVPGALSLGALLVAGAGAQPTELLAERESGPWPEIRTSVQETCGQGFAERIREATQTLRSIVQNGAPGSQEDMERRTDSLVADVVALHTMATRILGQGRWSNLGDHRRNEFIRALTRHLRQELLTCVEGSCRGIPDLMPAEGEARVTDNGTVVDYWLTRGDKTEPLTFHLSPDPESSCGIVDLRSLEESLVGQVRREVDHLREEYSFPYMIAEIGHYDHVILEDFERSPADTLPVGWDWKDKDDDSHKPYRVREANGNKYLEATDEGESVILGRELEWNLDKYPIVSFRVRVNEIPQGADERYDDKVDSAAGIYFTVDKSMFGLIPKSVKYVWSSTLPVGSATIRDGIGRPWQVVFGSGREGLGEWHTYYFDLEQAYRDTFGEDPPSKPLGIGVLSDANSMGGKAYADYDDIRALKRAPPGVTVTSGVETILESGQE